MTHVMRPERGRLSRTRPQNSGTAPCVDDKTEALTARGWLPYSKLQRGDLLRTLDLYTGRSMWAPLDRVYVYRDARLVRNLDARSHSSVTSLDHRWVTRDHYTGELRIRTSRDLRTNDRIIRAAPSMDTPTTPMYSDALVELLAWFWTEGHIRPDGAVQIFQSWRVNPNYCLRIREAMREVFGDPAVTMCTGRWIVPAWIERKPTERKGVIEWYLNRHLAATLTDLAPNRAVLPSVVASMTQSQLRIFTETSVDADGFRTRSRSAISQKRLDQLNAAEMAYALLGVPTTRIVAKLPQDRTCWILWVGSQAEIRPVAAAQRADAVRARDVIETVSGVGWCPKVPTGTWLARRRGTVYYTGDAAPSGQLALPLAMARAVVR